jgi:hypothetical protein
MVPGYNSLLFPMNSCSSASAAVEALRDARCLGTAEGGRGEDGGGVALLARRGWEPPTLCRGDRQAR